jgi:SET and MYND domain-containing protein 4
MQKSNERSEKLRKVGNEYYSNKRFYEALVKYNESACFAENSSENLGNAFANRSAVYFETRQYEHAINSIKLARQNGYPEKNLNILKTREEKCLEFLKKRRNSEQMRNENLFFQLSHKAKKSLPSIADCLELRCDETYGRHVITNKNLKVGDIIAHDEPFCAVLLSQSKFVDVPDDNIYRRCLNCFRENFLNLVPCENCCEGK